MNTTTLTNASAAGHAIDLDGRDLDHAQLVAQVGHGNVLAVSGGRRVRLRDRLILPCGNSYHVVVVLAADDTYTVARVTARAGRASVKGRVDGVYADEVGEQVYRAGMFRDAWAAGGIA